ncbi:MAG: hypothetical protein C0175_00070 [Caldisericum exile]|uniref:Glycosyltransferase family 1 protein n=1 Tax=Caldisericum exile TaxID=693075 RepID=A0A2J6XA98_9BACT|nr:MAG: hypothetical protein C0175_00070 [Caldisericum exile]
MLFELSKLFLQLKDVNLTLFVSKEVFKRLDDRIKSDPRVKFIQYDVPRTSGRLNFIKNRLYMNAIDNAAKDIKEKVNNGDFDLVIFETLQGLPFLKASYNELSAIRSKKAAVVHDADVWAGEKRNVPFSLRINDSLSHNYFKKWIKKLDYLITLEDEQTEYLKEKNLFDHSKIITLRGKFTFESKDYNNTTNGKIIFTIPGSVDHLRRNYSEFLNAFERIAQEYDYVEGYLLGRMMDEDVRRRILSSEVLKSHLKFWDESVPNDEFEEVISKSHFIVLPIAGNYRYGITKITGPLYDALVDAKPVMISNNIHVNPKYMKSVLIYDLKDTYDILKKGINMVESGEYLNLIEEAKKVRELFKPDNFVEEISKMIKNEG